MDEILRLLWNCVEKMKWTYLADREVEGLAVREVGIVHVTEHIEHILVQHGVIVSVLQVPLDEEVQVELLGGHVDLVGVT